MTTRSLLKFFVTHPYPDESISSLMDRIGETYEVDRARVLSILCKFAEVEEVSVLETDCDDPPEPLLRALERMIEVPSGTLEAHRIIDGPAWLTHKRRVNYCPSCFADDENATDDRHFRREWARVTATICHVHELPLRSWPRYQNWHGRRMRTSTPVPLRGPDGGPEVLDTHWLGYDVAQGLITLERELTYLIDVHGDLTGSSVPQIRELGLSVTTAAATEYYRRGNVVAGALVPTAVGWHLKMEYVDFRSREQHDQPWLALRQISDPAERRAAFFLVASERDSTFPMGSVTALPMGASPFATRCRKAIWRRHRAEPTQLEFDIRPPRDPWPAALAT